HVDVDDLDAVFPRERAGPAQPADARVGDDEVEPAELLVERADRARRLVGLRHVEPQRARSTAAAPDALGELLGDLDPAGGQHDLHPRLAELLRERRPDAARGAGDERGVVAERSHPAGMRWARADRNPSAGRPLPGLAERPASRRRRDREEDLEAGARHERHVDAEDEPAWIGGVSLALERLRLAVARVGPRADAGQDARSGWQVPIEPRLEQEVRAVPASDPAAEPRERFDGVALALGVLGHHALEAR